MKVCLAVRAVNEKLTVDKKNCGAIFPAMTLKDWLAQRGIKQSWLADRVGAQASAMSLYVNHLRLPKLPLRILIEQETGGAVNRHSDWPNGKERQ